MQELATYLDANNLKQKDFAEQIGVTEAAVSQWLSGKATPKNKHIAKIRELTGIPVQKLAPWLFASKSDGRGVRSRSQSSRR